MSAKLFIASKCISYYKSGFKKENEINTDNESKRDTQVRREKIIDQMKNKYHNQMKHEPNALPFYGEGIRNYKFKFRASEYRIVGDRAIPYSATQDSIKIHTDANGDKYIYRYCYMDGIYRRGYLRVYIDGEEYRITKGIEEIELSSGVHEIKYDFDFTHINGDYDTSVKCNRTEQINLQEGNNYLSIIAHLIDGYSRVEFDSKDIFYYGEYHHTFEKYTLTTKLEEVKFDVGIVSHKVFVSEHIDNYYVYEADFPKQVTEEKEFSFNTGNILRVSNEKELEPIVEAKTTVSKPVEQVVQKPSIKQEYKAPPKPKKYYEDPILKDIMSAFDYTIYEDGMTINKALFDTRYLCIPENVICIGERAFMGKKTQFLSTVECRKDLKFIENAAFMDCINLQQLRLNEGLLQIDDSAFSGCSKLVNVTIPSTVKYIGAYAFYKTCIKEILVPVGCKVHPNAFDEGVLVVHGSSNLDITEYKNKLRKRKEEEALAALREINKRLAELDEMEAELEAKEEAERQAKLKAEEEARQAKLKAEEEAKQAELKEQRRIEREKRKAEQEALEKEEAIKRELEEQEFYNELAKDDPVEQQRQKEYGKIFKFRFNELIKYIGTSTKVTIPDFINQIKVDAFSEKNISELIFSDDLLVDSLESIKCITSLKKLHLPNNITIIPANLCKKLGELEYVFVPETVTEIDDSAFEGCISLKYIEFDQNIKSLKIGKNAFKGCSSLTEVVLPKNTTIIGEGAFRNCKNLDTILLPFEIEKILSYAFAGCPSLFKMIIPPKVHFLGENIFDRSTGITELYLCGKDYYSGNVPSLDGLNIHCKIQYVCELTELAQIITTKDYKNKKKVTSLEDVLVLHDIEREDLYTKLYKEIHGKAPEVNLNKKITDTIFYKKNTLDKKQEPAKPKTLGSIINKEQVNDYKKEVVKEVPVFEIIDGILTKYNADEDVVIIPKNVHTIRSWAFENKNTKKIIYEGSGTFRMKSIYEVKDTLEEIILGDNVESVQKDYTKLLKLKYIKFGNKVNLIEDRFATDFTELQKIEFTNPKVAILEQAFKGCSNLVEVIGDVDHIRNEAFMGCSKLSKIDVSNTTCILESAFKGCESLEEFTLADTLETIGDNVFEDCINLKTINFYMNPDNLKWKDKWFFKQAFKGCNSIKKFNYNCDRMNLTPYLNDENGRPFKFSFEMVKVKKK